MTKEMSKKILENNGLLLTGRGLDRGLGLFDTTLVPDNKYSDAFNWGYVGTQTLQASWSILSKLYKKSQAESMVELFAATILAVMPPDNFTVLVDITKYYNITTGKTKTDKAVHPTSLIKFKAIETFFSLYLYFAAAPYKNAEFGADTLEYKYLKELTESRFKELVLFTKESSKHIGADGKTVHTTLAYCEITDSFSITDGLGTGRFTGTKI